MRFNGLILLALTATAGAVDRVSVSEGRILLQRSSGQTITLTQTGLDSDPWLTPDGATVVFLRHAAEDVFRTTVYEIDVGTQVAKILYEGPVKYQGREGSYFGEPELDESQGTLFLISKEGVTSGSLVAIRLADGQAKLISDHVVGYGTVECPRDRGDLIVLKRQQDILGSPYTSYWLYSAAGEQLGLAGADELDVETLRDGACEAWQPLPPLPSGRTGSPADAPPPPASTTSTELPRSGGAIQVEGGVMEGRLVTRVEPAYPNSARLAHIEGDVRLQVRIAVDGTVQNANLVSGPPQLVAAAIAAVRQWRYQPVMSSGHAVPVLTVVSVKFRLPSTDR